MRRQGDNLQLYSANYSFCLVSQSTWIGGQYCATCYLRPNCRDSSCCHDCCEGYDWPELSPSIQCFNRSGVYGIPWRQGIADTQELENNHMPGLKANNNTTIGCFLLDIIMTNIHCENFSSTVVIYGHCPVTTVLAVSISCCLLSPRWDNPGVAVKLT